MRPWGAMTSTTNLAFDTSFPPSWALKTWQTLAPADQMVSTHLRMSVSYDIEHGAVFARSKCQCELEFMPATVQLPARWSP